MSAANNSKGNLVPVDGCLFKQQARRLMIGDKPEWMIGVVEGSRKYRANHILWIASGSRQYRRAVAALSRREIATDKP